MPARVKLTLAVLASVVTLGGVVFYFKTIPPEPAPGDPAADQAPEKAEPGKKERGRTRWTVTGRTVRSGSRGHILAAGGVKVRLKEGPERIREAVTGPDGRFEFKNLTQSARLILEVDDPSSLPIA